MRKIMAIPRIESYSINPDMLAVENRVRWSLDSNRAVLLIHDMQQYFLDFYDQTQAPIPEVIRNIQQLKKLADEQEIPVVYTAQPGDQTDKDRALLTDFWGPGLTADEQITRIIPAVAPTERDTVLTKWRYSAFQRSDLLQRMQRWQRDQLIIVGVYTHIGCLQTAMEAFMSDIKAFLIGDATADFSAEEQAMGLKYVASRGGRVVTTNEAVAQLTNILEEV
jgi:bifunctional isochorismate lyase/aryl carrier protein